MAGALRPPSPAIVDTLVRLYMYGMKPEQRALLYAFVVPYISLFLFR